jgi:hypothetical protein
VGALVTHIGKVKLHTRALRTLLTQCAAFSRHSSISSQAYPSPIARSLTVRLLGLLSVCGVRNIDGARNPILEGVPGPPWALIGKSVQIYY